MNRIVLLCAVSIMCGVVFIGCDRISNDDTVNNQDSLETTTNIDDTSITEILEDTQVSMTISLETVPMATNSSVEISTDTTTSTSATYSTTLDATEVTTSYTSTIDTSSSSEEYTTPNMLDLVEFTNNQDALPPLDDTLQTLFQDAFYTYYEFTSAETIQVDKLDIIDVDGREYSKVIDNRFTSIDEVSTYLSQYFTDDFIESSYILNRFIELNGSLYTNIVARSCNVSYCGHTFEILEQSTDEISFQALVYFNIEGTWIQDYYFINETPNVDYVTELSRYVLVNTPNGWRFDTFSPIY
ncbi:MAG: IseA DL-endopeptidase inhibitor family protein [Ruminococcus sp.]|nr:IseA DL-endopeptidase inhibitor family protein [Ruminococcus sp.]MCD7801208.1 IseA DL-endopeptidase inhibitor family protein [Ruminococcus sp.]